MNVLLALALLLALTGVFYLFFSYCYRIGMGGLRWRAVLDRNGWRVFVAFMTGVLLLCTYLLVQNRFVYYWDYGGYWTWSYTQMKDVFADPVHAFGRLYVSICDNDYNLLLPTLLSLPLKIFGYSFGRYVMVNVLFFFVPLSFVLLSLCVKLSSRTKSVNSHGIVFEAVSLLCVVTFNVFYLAMLKGYVDVACLLPASLVVLLSTDYQPCVLDKRQVSRDLCISGCLLCAFLFRRYFAYFVVGYAVALAVYSVYESVVPGNVSRLMRLKKAVANLLIVGGSALVVMSLLFRPMLVHILTNDYAGQYAGYDAPVLEKIGSVFETFGLWTVALSATCVVLAFVLKKYRKTTSFCAVSMVVTTFAFFRVQNMGIHHVYVLAAGFFVTQFLAVLLIGSLFRRRVAAAVFVAVCLVVSVCGSVNCFFPMTRGAFAPVSKLFSKEYDPFQRNDIAELHRLVNYLNSLTAGTDMRVYIDASGSVLNNSIIDSLDKPYGTSPLINQCTTADVDLRDGFPVDFLTAKIVVTTDPVQLHLAEGTQEVVRYLSEQVMDPSSPIGRHFTEESASFQLDDGVQAHVYVKQSEFEERDLQLLASYFTGYYPGYKSLFADRILGANE